MVQFNGVMPDNVDLSGFEGIPDYLKNKQTLLSDYNPERDKDLVVRFFTDSYFQGFETKKLGVPIFSTEIFVEVLMPDNRSSYVKRIKVDANGSPLPNVAKWTTRFPVQWEQFKKGLVSGYPLEKVPGIDKGAVATLEMLGVKTAEAFADLEGEIFERLPALKELQADVKKFLASKDIISAQADKIKELESKLHANGKANSTKRSKEA